MRGNLGCKPRLSFPCHGLQYNCGLTGIDMRWICIVWTAFTCVRLLAQEAEPVPLRYKLTASEVLASRVRAALMKNGDRGAKLKDLFSEAGCTAGDLQLQPVKHATVPNIICTVRGATGSMILVGAHFDHVKHGLGVIDNWSGASLLPSLAETVRSLNRRHTFVFVGFTDEERGLVGSYFYVSQLDREGLSRIEAMINFDSVGAGPTKVEHSTADANLLQKLVNVAGSAKLPLTFMDMDEVGTSDFLAFRSKHVPTLIFHSLTQETLKLLHRSADNYQALKMDDYCATYRLAAAYLAYLDVTLDIRPRLGNGSMPPTLRRP